MVLDVARQAGLGVLSWSVDPKDWATRDGAGVQKAILDVAKDGDVVLLHDMTDSSVDAALAVIDGLQQQGYRFVTVSELVKLRHADITPGQVYRKFPPEEGK